MSTKRRKTVQASKGIASKRAKAHQDFVTDLRNGSRTTPIASGTNYRRRPKHLSMGWDD